MANAPNSRLGKEGQRDSSNDALGPSSSSQAASKRRKVDTSSTTAAAAATAAAPSATYYAAPVYAASASASASASAVASSSSSPSLAGPASQAMLPGRPLPLLVCSIGNPGPHYADTLHSAGHTLLNRLAARLGYASFHREKALGNGQVSYPLGDNAAASSAAGGSTSATTAGGGGDWTLWQSPSYMNESGKSVRAAYAAWAHNLAGGSGNGSIAGRLVIVHDELEKPLGAVTLRTAPGASAKGHNGLKSIIALLGPTVPFARIGVGIGRPASRQSDDVARYVLRKMDSAQLLAIEGTVDQVIAKLRELERG